LAAFPLCTRHAHAGGGRSNRRSLTRPSIMGHGHGSCWIIAPLALFFVAGLVWLAVKAIRPTPPG